MVRVRIDPEKTLGKIKPMHGIGQPPLLGTDTSLFHYLTEASIPYSRLHDVGGWFGGNMFVDIPNIFRDFNADVNDPESYDFAFTDILIKGLVEAGCEPVFRLGVTIENFHEIKYYRIAPPADSVKWAIICEHIIRHYNEGWAGGFYFHITYWEIWNEPDGHYLQAENAMWKGTPEQYFELYRVTSKHLKKCFGSSIKVGGYASCGFYWPISHKESVGEAFGTGDELTDWDKRTRGFIDFFDAFLDLVTAEKLPLDFFSYHSYLQAEETVKMQEYCERRLNEKGLKTEIHLNEWNTAPAVEDRPTEKACSCAVAMMCAMHHTKADILCFYDGRLGESVYGGLFNPLTYKPLWTYYGFSAFGMLYRMGTEIQCEWDSKDLFALAASDSVGNGGLLITNKGEGTPICLEGVTNLRPYLVTECGIVKYEKNPAELFAKKFQTLYIEFDT